jgi:hypothetical protein
MAEIVNTKRGKRRGDFAIGDSKCDVLQADVCVRKVCQRHGVLKGSACEGERRFRNDFAIGVEARHLTEAAQISIYGEPCSRDVGRLTEMVQPTVSATAD